MRYSISEIYDSWAKKEKNIVNNDITLYGWIEFNKANGDNFFFLVMRDGSSFKTIHAVFDNKKFRDQDLFQKLMKINKESSISVTGRIAQSPGKGKDVELMAIDAFIFSEADDNYQISKNKSSLELTRNYQHIRGKTRTFQALGILRNNCYFETQNFYNKLGFINIACPILTTNKLIDESFSVSAFNGVTFKKNVHLISTGQLHLESFANCFEKVYSFGPVMRAEKSDTGRHLAEFWMIEPEMSFVDLSDLMNNMELYLKYICNKILEKNKDVLEYFDSLNEDGLLARIEKISKIGDPFVRKRYDECLKFLEKEVECKNVVLDNTCETKRISNGILILNKIPKFGDELVIDVLKYLADEFGGKPFFITHYPKNLRHFSVKESEDDKITGETIDLIFPGIGELMSGAMREDNFNKLKNRIVEKGNLLDEWQWYLDLRKNGSVPHGGYSIGFERLLMALTGIKNIKDVVNFFRVNGYCFA